MTPVWPEDFPAPLFGTEYSPVDPQIRTPMQSGRTFVRRNFTAVPVMFPVRLLFKSDELAARFEDFYRVTLEDGSLWFKMPMAIPQGRGPWLVQFQGIYTGPRRMNAPGMQQGLWEYRAELMMFLRPGETTPSIEEPTP